MRLNIFFYTILPFLLFTTISNGQITSKRLNDTILHAYTLVSDNKIDQAYLVLEHAKKENEKLKDKSISAFILNIEGIIKANIGNWKEALEKYNKAISIYNQLNDTLRAKVIEGNIGYIYNREGNFKKSDSIFMSNIETFKKHKYNRMFYVYRSIIESLFKQKRFNETIKYCDEAIEQYKNFDFESNPNNLIHQNIKERVIKIIQMFKAFSLFELRENMAEAIRIMNGINYIFNDNYIWNDVIDYSNVYKYKILYFGKYQRNSDSLEYYIDKSIEAANNNIKKMDSVKIRIRNYAHEFTKKEKKLEQLNAQRAADQEIHQQSYIIMWLCIAIVLSLFFFFMARQKNFKKQKQLSRLLLSQNKKLKNIDKERMKFFSIISHELKTPAHGLYGLTQLLTEEHENPRKQQNYIKTLHASARYLNLLINNILQFSRFNLEKIKPKFHEFDLFQFLENLKASFEFTIKESFNELKFEIDERIPRNVVSDKSLIYQILINLIVNGLKFTENGLIRVRVELIEKNQDKSKIKFSVIDNGIGISPDLQKNIFKAYKVSSKNEKSGTGLGLYIVKNLILILGSTIHLISEKEKGSTFYFTLELENGSKALNSIHIKNNASSIINNKKILIVDDNKVNLLVAYNTLKKYTNNCETATNGAEAIEKIKKNHFDLILMDIGMPLMDGYQTSRTIRKFNTTVPIIALTAFEQNEVFDKALAAGMNNVQLKPIKLSELISNIETIFKNSHYENA